MKWTGHIAVFFVCLYYERTLSIPADIPIDQPARPGEPYFDAKTVTNYIALKGNSVKLVCNVHNARNRTVLWIRLKDMHVLTVDSYTYTSEQRFECLQPAGSIQHILHIKYVQYTDAGYYLCQVQGTPQRALQFEVKVLDALTASINGASEIFVHKGSTINLTCTVPLLDESPVAYIFWYFELLSHYDNVPSDSKINQPFHPTDKTGVSIQATTPRTISANWKVVSYDSDRGGINIFIERGIKEVKSTLVLRNAGLTDSGRYTCFPSNADMAVVNVHVLDDVTALTWCNNNSIADTVSLMLITILDHNKQ